jgi:polar amino acid transport system substrate-binding protein
VAHSVRTAAVLLALAAPSPLRAPVAGEEPAVRVVTEDLPPYSFEDVSVVKGASTAVVRAVLERAGLRYSIELVPWKRALDTALHERNTFIYSVARTETRERQLVWVGRICDRRLALYCLKDRPDLLRRPLADLQGATFAVIQGDASIDLLRKLGVPDGNLHLMRDSPGANTTRHVLERRSDFFVSNPLSFEHRSIGTDLEGRFRQHSILWQGDGYYLAANLASDPALVGRVRDAFAALQGNGALKAVFERAIVRPPGE